jgi:hypothetical protein
MSLDNNNPGNLKPGKKTWTGQTGTDPDGFLVFDDLEDGFRAMAITIAHHIKTGYNTITKLIDHYSETDQDAYIKFVSDQTGVDPNAILSLNHDSLDALMAAMYEFEIGSHNVDQDTEDALAEGLHDAETSRPDLYTMPTGSAPAGPQTQPTQPQQNNTPKVPSPIKNQAPTLPSVMQTAGFGQEAIDWITNSKIGWVEVGIGVVIVFLIFKPKLEL